MMLVPSDIAWRTRRRRPRAPTAALLSSVGVDVGATPDIRPSGGGIEGRAVRTVAGAGNTRTEACGGGPG